MTKITLNLLDKVNKRNDATSLLHHSVEYYISKHKSTTSQIFVSYQITTAPTNEEVVLRELVKLENLSTDDTKRLRFLSSLRPVHQNEVKYFDVLNVVKERLSDIRTRWERGPDSYEVTELVQRLEELEEELKVYCV